MNVRRLQPVSGRISKPPRVESRVTLDASVASEVRRRIVSLEYEPGVMIYENAISEEFRVSRTPVHHAFLQLMREGLLEILPQRGARVSYLSLDTVKKAQYMRECLEAAAFADAARIYDAGNSEHGAWLLRLKRLTDEQIADIEANQSMGFVELDAAFHNEVLNLVGNELLIDTVNQMRNHLNRVRFLELRTVHHEREMHRHHLQLIDLLTAKDAEGARIFLIAHLRVLEAERDAILSQYPQYFEEG